jgi:hypothetical protein
MDEFAAALQFFLGFGENWHALLECLEYLDEWLPADAYVLVIEDAEELLCEARQDEFLALLKTLHEAGNWWSKPITDNGRFNRGACPFHVLLYFSSRGQAAALKIAEIADLGEIPIRRGGTSSSW